ncbi:hypothetical protein [Bartonella koehlerae]
MLDVKEIYSEDFLRDFIFLMFRANAVYEEIYLLKMSVRSLFSKCLMELSRKQEQMLLPLWQQEMAIN